jgi:8-oxo-dGTP pyrophosphatase MutT (NUDIX family)
VSEVSAGVATVILVDRRGWVLLQERDEHALVAPNQWGLVGGHVKPGETFKHAIYRELYEETGLRWESGLLRWFDGQFCPSDDSVPTRFQVWVAPTRCTDNDIVVGEGRQIVFVDPARLDALDVGESAGHFVRKFVRSPTYSKLAQKAALLSL